MKKRKNTQIQDAAFKRWKTVDFPMSKYPSNISFSSIIEWTRLFEIPNKISDLKTLF